VVADARYDCPFWTILATLLAQKFSCLKIWQSAVQEIPYFSATKRFVRCLQKSIIGSCPEPVASNQHSHPISVTHVLIVFSDRNFICVFLSIEPI
jgi:hypothetical protein